MKLRKVFFNKWYGVYLKKVWGVFKKNCEKETTVAERAEKSKNMISALSNMATQISVLGYVAKSYEIFSIGNFYNRPNYPISKSVLFQKLI